MVIYVVRKLATAVTALLVGLAGAALLFTMALSRTPQQSGAGSHASSASTAPLAASATTVSEMTSKATELAGPYWDGCRRRLESS